MLVLGCAGSSWQSSGPGLREQTVRLGQEQGSHMWWPYSDQEMDTERNVRVVKSSPDSPQSICDARPERESEGR